MILDTHVWIWVVEGTESQLSDDAIHQIDASSRRGEVLVSAISVWEVATLEARGRISLSHSVEEWVQLALRAPGTRLLDLSPEIAIESTRLPDSPHGDPADRILIAGARVMGVRLATRDERIIRYGKGGHLAVLDARP
ncbi:MAG: type II toxin-antitoxin system VapC family toxin [Gemmatimonadota bacterium]